MAQGADSSEAAASDAVTFAIASGDLKKRRPSLFIANLLG